MSRTGRLRAAAHNVLHAMSSGLAHDGTAFFVDHLGFAAARAGVSVMELDLVTAEVRPAEAATPALTRYAVVWRERWPPIVLGVGADPTEESAVVIAARSDLTRRANRAEFLVGEIAYIEHLTCTIVDSAGVQYTSEPPRNQLYLRP